ncbi:TPA: dTDP-glucose 4,6-dehydratase [Candidatus Uhrbacteria bacterium]|nr:dTDP-glucose 4,6-dehydratase [Candidatus Uhrbacteria bacterium]
MTILVTGGAGFIGSNFVHYWVAHHPEDRIIVLDKLTYAGNLRNLESVANKIRFVKGDICDHELVFSLVKDVDRIVHFAAESHNDRAAMDPESFLRTNIFGTYNLLDAARQHQIKRFHHVSTDEVFGHLPLDGGSFNEQSLYAPRSIYPASKAASDHFVRAFYHTHGLPITISNCSNNYGPYHFPEKIIPLFICNLREGKKVPVYGDGLYVRDWIHVEDHCRGIEAILLKGRVGETYCLGGKESEISNLELTKKLLALTDRDESFIEYVKDRPGHDRRYSIDYSKAQRELGWEPTIGIDEGLKNTVDWYANHQAWVDEVRSGAYQDYYEKQYVTR